MWGKITDQTYLANGINSGALPKEEENLYPELKSAHIVTG